MRPWERRVGAVTVRSSRCLLALGAFASLMMCGCDATSALNAGESAAAGAGSAAANAVQGAANSTHIVLTGADDGTLSNIAASCGNPTTATGELGNSKYTF